MPAGKEKEFRAREKKLKGQAQSKGLSGERADAYVYGTLRKMYPDWKPKREKKAELNEKIAMLLIIYRS